MKPKVTIIIPFYNCSYVEKALDSALNQSYRPIEVILVDDGSTKHTERLVPYRKYIHYLGKQNGGTASALNHGIRHASGDYIAWLSSDDVFHTDKIYNQLYFMLQYNSSISHTNFNYIDDHGSLTQVRAGEPFVSTKRFLECFASGNPVNGCTVMFKKQIFDSIGLFDESLPYTHDLDMWYRVLLGGHFTMYLDQALVNYRLHSNMGTRLHSDRIKLEYDQVQARYQPRFQEMLRRICV
ncbi:glycosyltransferase [Paenibacillus sp. P96]|uniref:Glycosyltransferase n=1 Tax=Paenibacillus zeirhizosphaerae TaxID=2987519 RepID=A0ABT9FUT4_9BACL|nr:glycosyltransferase [Paenibacillus sp. P96]MDP4098494.1 glycosyltransferase [Paenibacillus sp. P96]